MKIQLWTIGKPHDSYVKDGIELYSSRIENYFPLEWKIIASPRNAGQMDEASLKKEEAALILKNIKNGDCLILLDETGKMLDSPGLAQLLDKKAAMGSKSIIFLIGGAFGVDPSIIQRADFVWSLSKLVFPHMLVRLILSEQLYRAATILHHEKYHHGK